MTEAELDEIEARLGIELPTEYRAAMLDYPFPPDSWPAQAEMPNGASFLVAMNERLAKQPPPGWTPMYFAFGQDGENTYALELGVPSPPVLILKRDREEFEVDAESLDEWVQRRIVWYVDFDPKLAERKYELLVSDIEASGFFTSSVEPMNGWDRIAVASRRAGSTGLTGISFWVSRMGEAWFLGTWGGWVYRLEASERLAGCCIEWLQRGRGIGDFDEQLKRDFGLVRLSDDEFDAAVAAHG